MKNYLRKRIWLCAKTPIDAGPYHIGFRIYKKFFWLPFKVKEDNWFVSWLSLVPEY